MARDHVVTLAGRLSTEAAGARLGDLFEEYGRMVYGLCRLLLRDWAEAEDAAQQTFLSAYRSILSGHEPREPAAWLATIARNECRARIRARMPEPLSLVREDAPANDPAHVAGQRAEVAALCEALAELPQQQREAIVLREFYGLSYEEVAVALGVSGSAVESLLFRSRRRLQERLRSTRLASGALALPLALRDALAEAAPGFAAGSAAAGGGAGVAAAGLAKLSAAPLAAKLAAATLAAATVGTVGAVEIRDREAPARPEPRIADVRTLPRTESSLDWAVVRASPLRAIPVPSNLEQRLVAEGENEEPEREEEGEAFTADEDDESAADGEREPDDREGPDPTEDAEDGSPAEEDPADEPDSEDEPDDEADPDSEDEADTDAPDEPDADSSGDD